MSFELIIFTTPQAAQGVLRLDNGTVLSSHLATHESGRLGIGFSIPDNTPNGNGAGLTLFSDSYITIRQRAILWLRVQNFVYPWIGNQQAAFAIDDFTLPVATPPAPQPPQPIPPGGKSPIEIINEVYATGLYNLTTKQGCGQFTEECCTQLHERHSVAWGHIHKNPGQEQYNGHAVDAIMLLQAMPDCDRGIYDIIVSSQSPDAHPALNRVGDPNPSLWYYPA